MFRMALRANVLLVLPVVLACSAAFAAGKKNAELDRLFNQGLDLLNHNKAYQARALFQRAAAMDPGSAAIHCNLGLAYQNSGNLQQATSEFKTALQLAPTMPEAMLNMAGCYQSLGQFNDAINWYQRFLRQNPKAAQAEQIKDVIGILQEKAANPASNPQLPDYLELVTADEVCRWPVTKLPIKVFIDTGARVSGFRPSFRTDLIGAFDTWVAASGNKLSYSLVPAKEQADIVCEWTSDPAEVAETGTQAERGMSHVFTNKEGIYKGTLKVLTLPALESGVLSDDDMKKACLHEVGHLLGLQGHSTNNHDVMFFTIDTSTVWPVLTKRDKLTITKLYEKYPILGSPPAGKPDVAKRP